MLQKILIANRAEIACCIIKTARRMGIATVALCPEVDVASQGETVDDARKNLTEALQLFFECAHEAEIKQRLSAPLIDVSSDIRNAF